MINKQKVRIVKKEDGEIHFLPINDSFLSHREVGCPCTPEKIIIPEYGVVFIHPKIEAGMEAKNYWQFYE